MSQQKPFVIFRTNIHSITQEYFVSALDEDTAINKVREFTFETMQTIEDSKKLGVIQVNDYSKMVDDSEELECQPLETECFVSSEMNKLEVRESSPEMVDLLTEISQNPSVNKSKEAQFLLDRLQFKAKERGQGLVEVAKMAGISLPSMHHFLKYRDTPQQRIDKASLFMKELLDSVEMLSDIANEYGSRTLSDIMFLQNSILKDGFIEYYPNESSVLMVVNKFPSKDEWLKYIQVDHGLDIEISYHAKVKSEKKSRPIDMGM